jgi:hypothetical protein
MGMARRLFSKRSGRDRQTQAGLIRVSRGTRRASGAGAKRRQPKADAHVAERLGGGVKSRAGLVDDVAMRRRRRTALALRGASFRLHLYLHCLLQALL